MLLGRGRRAPRRPRLRPARAHVGSQFVPPCVGQQRLVRELCPSRVLGLASHPCRDLPSCCGEGEPSHESRLCSAMRCSAHPSPPGLANADARYLCPICSTCMGRISSGSQPISAVPESPRGLAVEEGEGAVFLFFYFLFSFFTKIYFYFRNLQEYTPAAPLSGGRDLIAPLRGGRGFCAKTFTKIFARRSWGRRRVPAARQWGGRGIFL